jgi:hypothetical protein
MLKTKDANDNAKNVPNVPNVPNDSGKTKPVDAPVSETDESEGFLKSLRKVFEELSLKFTNLQDLKPDNVKNKLDFFDNVLKDETVHNFNPRAYEFYMNMLKEFKNPAILKNIIYETKLIKAKKKDEGKIISQIVSKLNELYRITDKNIVANDDAYMAFKDAKIQGENTEIATRLEKIMDGYDFSNTKKDDIVKAVKKTFDDKDANEERRGEGNSDKSVVVPVAKTGAETGEGRGAETGERKGEETGVVPGAETGAETGEGRGAETGERRGDETGAATRGRRGDVPVAATGAASTVPSDPFSGGAPTQIEAEQKITNLIETFENKNLLKKYAAELKDVLDAPTTDNKLKAEKLKDLLYEIEEDEATSIKSLEISKEDKLVFIGITFMIRLITLMIIDWALTSNFIITFTQAYMMYIGVYTVILLLFVVIVNMSFNLSVYDLYNGDGVSTSIASALYYFYIIPGNMKPAIIRLSIHLFMILAVTILALFIVGNTKTTDEVLNFDYSEKKRIRGSLSHFTLLLWLITSGFAFGK